MRNLFLVMLILALGKCLTVEGYEDPVPLFSVGGGRVFAGKRHSGGLIQFEYKLGKYWFGHIRPQASLAIPELRSLFFSVGLAFEIYLGDKFVLSPNFSPGLYYKGRGRDLGCPLEFRSCFEAAYVLNNGARFGSQFYHISNASISNRNPGENAWTLFLAFPLRCFRI